jgi:putative oxidoreductase
MADEATQQIVREQLEQEHGVIGEEGFAGDLADRPCVLELCDQRLDGVMTMMGGRTSLRTRVFGSTAPAAVIVVRVLVGVVFVSEGIQKFLYADALGVGRFAKIGIPLPGITAPFVGVVEIVCGALVALGLLTRVAAISLVIDMLVAIATTKFPMLRDKWFWAMAHETRTDWSMLLGSIFLLVVGAGRISLDARFGSSKSENDG